MSRTLFERASLPRERAPAKLWINDLTHPPEVKRRLLDNQARNFLGCEDASAMSQRRNKSDVDGNGSVMHHHLTEIEEQAQNATRRPSQFPSF